MVPLQPTLSCRVFVLAAWMCFDFQSCKKNCTLPNPDMAFKPSQRASVVMLLIWFRFYFAYLLIFTQDVNFRRQKVSRSFAIAFGQESWQQIRWQPLLVPSHVIPATSHSTVVFFSFFSAKSNRSFNHLSWSSCSAGHSQKFTWKRGHQTTAQKWWPQTGDVGWCLSMWRIDVATICEG